MACRKVLYPSKKSAGMAADRLKRLNGVRPNIYWCTEHGAWHVGYSGVQRAMMTKSKRRNYGRRRALLAKHR